MLRIKLIKSPIAHIPRNRATIQALGLRKVGQTVEQQDNAAIRGMIRPIQHLLIVWEGENETPIIDGRNARPKATRKDKKPSTNRR